MLYTHCFLRYPPFIATPCMHESLPFPVLASCFPLSNVSCIHGFNVFLSISCLFILRSAYLQLQEAVKATLAGNPQSRPIYVYNLDQIYDRSSPFAKPKKPEEIPGRGFKNLLFKKPKGDPKGKASSESAEYLLVIHNNSDAFGQNIETESAGGSLDGAIGVYSNAAACLARGKRDLLTNSVKCDWEDTSA